MYGQYNIYQYERQIGEQLNARLEQQQIIYEQLQHELANFLSDEYVERMARDELGLVRPHEFLFMRIN